MLKNSGQTTRYLFTPLDKTLTLALRTPAWRANLATAVFASLALGFTYLTAWRLTRSTTASLMGTGALAISHTFWTYAVMPKVYSLNALLLMSLWYLLFLWRDKECKPGVLWVWAFVYGLSFLNHLVMATVAAGFAWFILSTAWNNKHEVKIWRSIGPASVLFLIGLTPYILYLATQHTDSNVVGVIGRFLDGIVSILTHPTRLGIAIGWGIALWIYQFPISTIIGLIGLRELWRRDRTASLAILLSIAGVISFLFAAATPSAGGVYVWNLHYYLQAYVVFALAISAGLAYLWPKWPVSGISRVLTIGVLVIGLPVLAYGVAPTVARYVWSNIPDFRPLPGRDNFRYVLSPWKCREVGARQFGEAVLESLPQNSVLFSDYSIWAVLNYLQVVEGIRPDVELVRLPGKSAQVPLLLQYQDRADLFLGDLYRYYDLEGIQRYFNIVSYGPVYRLVPIRSNS